MPTPSVLRGRGWSAIMCRRLNKKAPFVVIWRASKVPEPSRLRLPERAVSAAKAHYEKERNEATC
jgi:hypothetical protein